MKSLHRDPHHIQANSRRVRYGKPSASREVPSLDTKDLALGCSDNMKKSLRIKGLDPTAAFSDMARLILQDRLRRVLRASAKYRKRHDPAELAGLRTALYRLRYPLECFVDCLPRRVFNAALDQIELLQRAVEQVIYSEAMLEELRTRLVGLDPDAAVLAAPASTAVEAEAADAAPANGVLVAESSLDASLQPLEEDRLRRLEAFDGALQTILDSPDLRRFRRALSD
ncbi:MAG: hypothetical protein GEEBNDBF_01269 [bacterium]|nr:hypothetical protein [bacterium]